jgi:hypothetical protein
MPDGLIHSPSHEHRIRTKKPHPGLNADLTHSGWIQMGQGLPEIATGAPRHGSTAEKEKNNDEAPLLLWQRHARQSSPASDASKQENASRAVGSESALLPVVSGSAERSALNLRRRVGLSLPHICTGHRGSARSVLEARILCEGGLWIWWRSHATVRLRLRHRFLYPWPRIAGIDCPFAS